MKTFTQFSFYFCIIFTFISCSKEQDIFIEQENGADSIQKAPSRIIAPDPTAIPYSAISLVGDMSTASAGSGTNRRLRFTTREAFIQTFKALDLQMQNYNEPIVSTTPAIGRIGIGGGGIGNIEIEEVDFSNKPIADFSNHFDMGSLFDKIRNEESVFLNTPNANLADNPANNYYIVEDALQALLNYNNEVQIGDTIFQFHQDGYSFYVNTNSSTVANIATPPHIAVMLVNYDYSLEEIYYACKSNRKTTYFHFNESFQEAIECKISHTGLFGNLFWCTAKIINWKLNVRGVWKKVRANSVVGLVGKTAYKKDCNRECAFGPFEKEKANTRSLSCTSEVLGRALPGLALGCFSGILYNHAHNNGIFVHSLNFTR
ncbi:MAG: hypothetical protein RRY15_00505 [Bacteroidales bacterium]